MYFLQHALCIFRHQIRVSRQLFKTQKQNLLFLPQKRDIHDNIESKKRCNYASFANYKTGYFSIVYLIGDERHHIAGDSLRTDSLNLVDSIRIYTSLYKTFNAGSVTYSREVNYKWNTLCLPYTFNASVEAGVRVIACKKANNDKIVINATNVQVVENPINVFQNNYYFIGNFTTNELFLSNNGYIIDNDCFKLYSDLQKDKKGDSSKVSLGAFRACFQSQNLLSDDYQYYTL